MPEEFWPVYSKSSHALLWRANTQTYLIYVKREAWAVYKGNWEVPIHNESSDTFTTLLIRLNLKPERSSYLVICFQSRVTDVKFALFKARINCFKIKTDSHE